MIILLSAIVVNVNYPNVQMSKCPNVQMSNCPNSVLQKERKSGIKWHLWRDKWHLFLNNRGFLTRERLLSERVFRVYIILYSLKIGESFGGFGNYSYLCSQ